MTHRECLGAAKCPYGVECFAERARERAMRSQLVVTNHSLLAIDAVEGVPMLPEYDVVVVDEAHELVARVTQAATDELSAADVERAARRAQRHIEEDEADNLADAGEVLRDAIDDCGPGRLDRVPTELADALVLVRDAARALVSAFPKEPPGGAGEPPDAAFTQAKGWTQELFMVAERMAAGSDRDVLWVSERERNRGGSYLCVAPLDVAGPMREKLLAEKTAVFTSATLKLGGGFEAMATSLGPRGGATGRGVGGPRRRLAVRLPPPGDPLRRPAPARSRPRRAHARPTSTRSPSWSTPRRGARSASSPAAGRPRPPPSTSARRCPT